MIALKHFINRLIDLLLFYLFIHSFIYFFSYECSRYFNPYTSGDSLVVHVTGHTRDTLAHRRTNSTQLN